MLTRAQRHEQVKRLKEAGLTFDEITDYLGLARSTVTDAYYDPSGEKARARKARRQGTCVDCGCPTYNSGSEPPRRCRQCRREWGRSPEGQRVYSATARRVAARWSEEQMIDAIRRLAVDGFLTVKDYRERKGPDMPDYQSIHKRIGWAAACERAGVKTRTYSPRSDRVPREGVILALQDCADAIGRVPTITQYEEWARRTGSPSGQTVRNRFDGRWMDALDAAFPVDPSEVVPS